MRKKRRQEKIKDEDDFPVLAVTSPHRISVLVEGDQIIESDTLQFASRPVSSASFLHTGHAIPSVFDVRLKKCWALQKSNKSLICYDSTSASGEENEASHISTMLSSPVLDLSLLLGRNAISMVYGTCEDGRKFLAANVDQEIVIDYIGSNHKTVDFVRTLAYPVSSDTTAKRPKTIDSSLEFRILQVFKESQGLNISSQILNVSRPHATTNGNSWVTTSHHHSFSLKLSTTTLSDLAVLCMSEVDDSLSIFYRLSNGDSFFAALSVSRSCLLGNPFVLPKNTIQAGLVSSGILSVLTKKQNIVLFDRLRGAEIAIHDLSHILRGSHAELVTDVMRSRVALLFLDKEEFAVAFSSVHVGYDSEDSLTALQGNNFTLASGLASSFSTLRESQSRKHETYNIVVFKREAEAKTVSDHYEIVLQQGLQLFTDAVDQMKSDANEISESAFLLDAFDSALDCIRRQSVMPTWTKNKKIAFHKNGETINGVYEQDRNPPRTVDYIVEQVRMIFTTCDKKSSQKNSTCILQKYFSAVAPIVVDLICSVLPNGGTHTSRQSACSVLQRVLCSGNLSSRMHFLPSSGDNSLRLLLTELEKCFRLDSSSYHPYSFFHDLLRFCPDVSESQIVCFIHLTLTRISADDIALFVLQSKEINTCNSLKKKSERFVVGKKSIPAKTDKGLGSSIILSGVGLLLHRAVEYSSYNDSLLRAAIGDQLNQIESMVLAEVSLGLLSKPSKYGVFGSTQKQRLVQWIKAIADNLRGSPEAEDTIFLKHLYKSLSIELAKTENILSLQNFMNGFPGSIRSNITKKTVSSKRTKEKQARDTKLLPPYQIERLLF
jgi:hypothetical protein